MSVRCIAVRSKPLEAATRAPSSKSVTHRALVAAALSRGTSHVRAPLDAEDTRATRDGLAALGVRITDGPATWVVEGCSGSLPGGGRAFLGASGTSLRLLTAVAALGRAPTTLDGGPRLRERPVQELARALTDLGAAIRLTPGGGGLPLEAGGSAPRGGTAVVRATESSQFASALLLIGPHMSSGLELVLEPPVVSLPYVELTAMVLEAFGGRVERAGELRWRVQPGWLDAREYRVEGDHSSASYFLAAAAIVGGSVCVENISHTSLQPDARLGSILSGLGCTVEHGPDSIRVTGTGRIPSFDLDLRDAPDLVPTLAVLGLFADGPCRLTGIAHLRLKESDRTEVLAENLRRLGRPAVAGPDHLTIGGKESSLRGGVVRTEADHRMAMAFAVAGLRLPGVGIDDPACVAKSNPAFWSEFERIEGRPG